ncbi:hypothetical protein BOW53_09410 [Solemya pervernicosa gill symbiont]|uniref:Alginate export domain-containing protein n=2 Tax=Gammaproteobacteria incertae sedis TaxID=118884 RepID=A0A1T2L4J3_9GAMM|nr:hypothetical protein [Candidatus Reidiella endopervernicosa]OOZ39982.1 hypothetical protein BOW53_09410 [Solemya pervernicosa gill symbiont]QKQ27783.1 hypothetical protein HUE57_16955 [Candidatus Reidiella endopervernicosa]
MIVRLLAALLILVSFETPAVVGGHIQLLPTLTDYQTDDIAAVYGDNPAFDQALDLRLKAEGRSAGWEGAIHYELLALGGDGVATRQALAAAGWIANSSGLPNDKRRLFGLTRRIVDEDRIESVHRIDRLTLGYSSNQWVIRAGRQAVSWGNGLAFQALDFINPFAPLAINKDYKSGDDLLYTQYLFESGNDLQAVVLPRRDPVTGEVESDQSTVGVRFHAMESEFDLQLAWHYGEPRLGIGLAQPVGEAVWRFDLDLSRNSEGEWLTTLVTNLDYSWVWFNHNTYGYLEYFHSGVGENSRSDYLLPDSELSARIARGELYTLAQDYIAAGLNVEVTPLLQFAPIVLLNLNDESGALQMGFNYDWGENLQLLGGVSLPWGERGSEFGGVTVPTTPYYLSAGRQLYLQLGYFF